MVYIKITCSNNIYFSLDTSSISYYNVPTLMVTSQTCLKTQSIFKTIVYVTSLIIISSLT